MSNPPFNPPGYPDNTSGQPDASQAVFEQASQILGVPPATLSAMSRDQIAQMMSQLSPTTADQLRQILSTDPQLRQILFGGGAGGGGSNPPPGSGGGFGVQVDDVHGVRVPEQKSTPRMESYAGVKTQPLTDFSGLTPDQIIEREPPNGPEFGSNNENARAIGRELANLYRDAPSSKVSIGQTRAVAVDLNARGLSQDDAITAWKVFYDEALETHGPSYRYANGDVAISAVGFPDVIVVHPDGTSAPATTTRNDISGQTLGPLSARLPGSDAELRVQPR